MANKRLNATITIGGSISGALRGAFATAGKGLTQLGSEVRKLSSEQKMLGTSIQTFGRLGKDVDGLRTKYASVTEQLNRMRTATERLARVEGARQANLAKRAAIRGQMIDAVAVGMAASAPIAAAVAFENAMVGVAKQLEGARDDNGKLTQTYHDMSTAIQQLGRELPVPTNAIAEMVTAGLRMGVASDQVLEFVRRSAEMSTAFEMPEGELAESMGKIAGLYKIPIPAIGALADSINYLDDNAISKGSDIISYLTRVGGVASAVKVTGVEMAALGSTLLTLGERTETAGTATNAMFQKFAAADKGTKKFKAAMKEIGLSTSAIQKGMQVDAMGTMLKVMDSIAKLPLDKQLGVMVELVGLEHSDTMAKLANNTGELRKQLALANSEAAKGSMAREFQARMETTSAQFEITKNRSTELAVNLGSVLLPAINDIMGSVGPIVSSFADWSKEHPILTKAIVGTASAIAIGRVAFLAGAYAITIVKGAFIALRVAMMTNPITAILTGIATAAWLIYDNWEPISTWFKDMWGRVTGIVTEAWDWFKTNLSWHPLAIIANNWGAVSSFFGTWWQGVKLVGSATWETVKALLGWQPMSTVSTAWEPVKGYFTDMWDDIKATFGKALDWITKKIAWVGDTWKSTKSFFGMGDDEPVPDTGNAPGAPAKPKTFWKSTKSFFGMGDDEPVPDTGNAPGARRPSPALGIPGDDPAFTAPGAPGGRELPTPEIATARAAAGPVYTDNSQNTIQVTQQPGENSDQLAKRIAAEMEKNRQVRARASMTDGAGAQ